MHSSVSISISQLSLFVASVGWSAVACMGSAWCQAAPNARESHYSTTKSTLNVTTTKLSSNKAQSGLQPIAIMSRYGAHSIGTASCFFNLYLCSQLTSAKFGRRYHCHLHHFDGPRRRASRHVDYVDDSFRTPTRSMAEQETSSPADASEASLADEVDRLTLDAMGADPFRTPQTRRQRNPFEQTAREAFVIPDPWLYPSTRAPYATSHHVSQKGWWPL